jgi:outer membrane protein OmpA-like peptidoglycan-associated protein
MNGTDWVTRKRWGHRSPGGLFYLAILVVPLLLAAAFTTLQGNDLEAGLQKRTHSALQSHGIKGAKVEFDGRDATVRLPKRLPRGMDHGDVKSVVTGVDGVRVATLEGGASSRDGSTNTKPTSGEPDCNRKQRAVDAILGADGVAFADASATVTGDERRQLGKVAQLLAACDTSVQVIGYADPGAQRTSLLAQQRADAVAGILEAVGVEVNAAEGAGAGRAGVKSNNAEILVS